MMAAEKLCGTCFLLLLLQIVSSSDTDLETELEFLSEPSSRLVKPGDGRAIFRCNVSPPSADVRWLWKGQPIIHNRWVKVSKHKLSVHLGRMDKNSKFPHSTENGYFQCEAKLRGKALVSAPAELIIAVLEPFSIESDVYITAKRGNTAVIPCNPPYSVPTVITEFLFNNTVIDRSTEHQKLMMSGNLQIFNVKASDAGEYICMANNPYLSEKRQANHKVFLQVTEPTQTEEPRFVVAPRPKTSVVLGSNITLECVASGYPVPTITWRRRHNHLPNSRYQQIAGNLLLFGVRRGDEGTYYCEAENSIGEQISTSTVIEVQETPQIVKPPKDWLVDVGQNLTLDCVTRGHPKPIITWLHNGRATTFEATGKTKESRIVLRNVNMKHSGFYQCFASNELGTVYATSVVSVLSGNQSVDVDYDNEDYEDDDYDVDEDINSPEFHPKRKIPSLSIGHHPNHDESSSDDDDNITDADLDSVNKRPRKKKKSKGVKLIPPSRPEVTRLSDNSVMVRWGVPRNDGLPILFFKVQYREIGRRSTQWMTIDEDIAAHIHSYAVTDLRTGGKYRFRIAAVYSNNDNKLGPNSAKFILYKDPPTKKPIAGPLITHAEAASPSAITLHWEYTDIDSIPIEGFFIYYRATHNAGDYLKVTVLGANTRSHIISHLLPDTGYDIKTQCFNIAGTSEFSNIYTSKTKPSEAVGTRSRSSKSHSEDDVPSFSITEPVSSKNSDGNFILYVVIGVICGVLFIAISVFVALYVRQRQNRPQNSTSESGRETPIKMGNGHIAPNGYVPVPVADKVNISVNPLARLDADDSDKPDQYEGGMVSNNNEIIQLQTFSTNEETEQQPEQEATATTVDVGEEAETVILASNSGTKIEAPRSI